MKLLLLPAILAALSAESALADVYKCVGKDGKVSFASVPCPVDEGQASWQGSTVPTPADGPVTSSDEVVQRNLRAAAIMQQGRPASETTVTVVGDHSKDWTPEAKRQAAKQARAEQRAAMRASGETPKRIVQTCNGTGSAVYCYDNAGGRSTTLVAPGGATNTFGNTADGQRYQESGYTHPNGISTSTRVYSNEQ
ncbi:DUF4124 domain-containing protein [Pseudomonas sp. LA21]|uniref:DUF4124 domain-containing protein n=1 Tax=Pseudomonas sp. LA21 TaxID=2893373 RepID=UPI001FB7158B|nr:DUF4124 domain-containing protein [Pseudomonas sp. LA21]MCJ1887453.1 DUF4124 domain-containing protein [Pseudomonas sp. LA21]